MSYNYKRFLLIVRTNWRLDVSERIVARLQGWVRGETQHSLQTGGSRQSSKTRSGVEIYWKSGTPVYRWGVTLYNDVSVERMEYFGEGLPQKAYGGWSTSS